MSGASGAEYGRARALAISKLGLLAVTSLLVACATLRGGAGNGGDGTQAPPTTPTTPAGTTVANVAAATTALPLLSPASLGQSRQVTQLLRGDYGDNAFNLRCVIKIDAEQLTVVGVTSIGLRAFTLHYDGQHLSEERAAQMPAAPGGAELMNDLQLVYWPLASLRQAWHEEAGVEVSEPWPGTRRLKRAGLLLAEVHYAADPWNGRVWLRHFDHPYELYIESSGVRR